MSPRRVGHEKTPHPQPDLSGTGEGNMSNSSGQVRSDHDMTEAAPRGSELSKRAGRRLIQRAFVLAGRNRGLRQHLRHEDLTTLWVIEDWDFRWTVNLHRGALEFERRPAKRPDLTVTWHTADAFFQCIERSALAAGAFEASGPPGLQRTWEPVYRAFSAALREVLQNPVDENGDPLV